MSDFERRSKESKVVRDAGVENNARSLPALTPGTTTTSALLTVVVALAYGNSLRSGFAFDDVYIVQTNDLIQSLTYIPTLFTTDYWKAAWLSGFPISDRNLYRPAVLTTFALNYAVAGSTPWVYHLTNAALHLAVSATLYALARRLRVGWAFATGASLLFAAHPLTTEAVTGIVGRAEILMALGILLTLLMDLRRNPLTESRASGLSGISLFTFAVALFSKEQAMAFPALLMVVDALRSPRLQRDYGTVLWSARWRYGAYLSVFLLYLSMRLTVVKTSSIGFIENPLAFADPLTRMLTATKIAGHYFSLVLWPVHLSADYSYNTIPLATTFLELQVLLSAASWLGFFVLAWIALCRRKWAETLGLAITFLFFLPTSNLLFPIGTIMAERLFYLPLAGLCLAVAAACESVARWATAHRPSPLLNRLSLGFFYVLLALLIARTHLRTYDWRDSYNLFASIIRSGRPNAKGHFLFGSSLKGRDEFAAAWKQFQIALQIHPNYLRDDPGFAASYGDLLVSLGRPHEAVRILKEMVEKYPTHFALHSTLGDAYRASRQWSKAEQTYKKATVLYQTTPDLTKDRADIRRAMTLNELAQVYALQKKWEDSERTLRRAIAILGKPSNDAKGMSLGQITGNFGLLLEAQGEYSRAKPYYQHAISLLEAHLEEPDRWILVKRMLEYARVLRRTNRNAEALALEHRAWKVFEELPAETRERHSEKLRIPP